MSISADDDILQDFLIEAGEILEQLGEQLVELEQRAEDRDLLNAVFRGFHTIKGGASFLNLTALVDVCHRAEDVFNLLRQGERKVDANLMDVVLRVLDVLNVMFNDLRNGEEPTAADPELLEQLEILSRKDESPVAASTPAAQQPAAAAPPSSAEATGDITDQEFESLLDALEKDAVAAGESGASPESSGAASDEITDAEFESLLDQLHGVGKHGGVPAVAAAPASDTISEDEFEALLDQLHGQGKPPGGAPAAAPPPKAVTAPKPEPKPEPKPAPTPARKAERAGTADGQAGSTAGAAAAQSDTTVRVDTRRLDEIMNLVGELVLVRNRLATLKSSVNDEQMAKAVGNLTVVTSDLQASVMKTRMQPIKKVFGRFPRVVRDLARSLNKEVNLVLQGEETDLDKNLVEALADPLVHLVRNAVDHGIEAPEERVKAGKPRTGTVTLSAEQAGDHILLAIEDDGAGMDPEVLRRKVVEKGLMDADAAARLDEHECYNLIFLPGLSTKKEISDVSGRGVGMDVVKTRIAQLNGKIDIFSQRGKGTRIAIKVPLTLAILPTLMVMLGNQTFALPLASVSEILHLDLGKAKVVDGQRVVMVREKPLPIFYLRQWLVRDAREVPTGGLAHVVVVYFANQRVGFVVDQLIGQEEVVIKPLGALLHGLPGLAGATITGDGRIALILDVPSLMKAYAGRN